MNRAFLVFLAAFSLAVVLGWVGLPPLLYARAEQPAAFNHKLHTSDKVSLGCEDCHAIAADGRFSGIPKLEKCASCHAEPLGTSPAEQKLIREYVKPGREIPWLVYARQPDNVRFSHALHVKRAKLACGRCHGAHGASESLRPKETDRLSGYSRDIRGTVLARISERSAHGMEMSDCENCHAVHTPGRTSCLACHR